MPVAGKQRSNDTLLAIGRALRDFFIARSGAEMVRAIALLRQEVPQLPAARDADDVEFIFNRLFVGPAKPVAPPFASVYLGEDELVMSRSTLEVRHFYSALGLTSPWHGTLPDDHLALEIDACLYLRQICAMDRADETGELFPLCRAFFDQHLQVWVPRFCERVRTGTEPGSFMHTVVDLLERWLLELRQEISCWDKGAS